MIWSYYPKAVVISFIHSVEGDLGGLNLGSEGGGGHNEVITPSWGSEDGHERSEIDCDNTDDVGNDSVDEVAHPVAWSCVFHCIDCN